MPASPAQPAPEEPEDAPRSKQGTAGQTIEHNFGSVVMLQLVTDRPEPDEPETVVCPRCMHISTAGTRHCKHCGCHLKTGRMPAHPVKLLAISLVVNVLLLALVVALVCARVAHAASAQDQSRVFLAPEALGAIAC